MKKLLLILSLFYIVSDAKIVSYTKIDSNLKAIALASYLNKEQAENLALKFSKYDTYIKKTTKTQKKYFVVFCVNLPRYNLYQSLKDIQEILPSAYIASDSRVKQLSQDNVTIPKLPKKNFKKLNTPFIIDSNKDSITIKHTNSKAEALKIADSLSEYDIYLKRSLYKENNVYVVYIVNINHKQYQDVLKKVSALYPDSYKTSKRRVDYFMDNITVYDILIKGIQKTKVLQKSIDNKNNTKKLSPKTIKNGNHKFQIAYSLYKKQQYKKAIQLFQELLVDYSDNVKVNFYLGRSYYELKDYEQASAAFDRVTIIDQNNLRATLELAQTYLMLGMNDEAIKGFKKVLTHKIPDKVRKNIQKQIDYLESLNHNIFVSFNSVVGYTSDNNINSTTSVKEFIIPNYGSSSITDEIYSDSYMTYMLNGLIGYKLNDNHTIQNQNSIIMQRYNKDEYRLNNQNLTGISKEQKKKLDMFSDSLLYTYTNNNKRSISIGTDLSLIKIADLNYLLIGGGTIGYKKRFFSRNTFFASIKGTQKYYNAQFRNLNSKTIQVTIGESLPSIDYGICNFTYNYTYEKKDIEAASTPNKIKHNIVLSNQYYIDPQVSLDSSFVYSKSHETTDDITFLTKKVEYYKEVTLGIGIKILKDLSLSNSIKFIRNDSTIGIYSYDKVVYSCFLTKSF